jgi:hypothetical protein
MKERYSDELNWLEKLLGVWRVNKDCFDTKWGYFAPRFGFELQINRGGHFEQNYSIGFCLLWGMFNIKLPFKTKLPEDCEWHAYGINFFEDSIIWRWGRSYNSWQLPFVSWEFDFHQVKDHKGDWVKYEYKSDQIHKKTFDYHYELLSGEVQERKATCYIERRQWHRKWFPFSKTVRECISVDFNDEVGERSGSWKGGTLGCSYDLLKGETMEQCLRRMESEREFT